MKVSRLVPAGCLIGVILGVVLVAPWHGRKQSEAFVARAAGVTVVAPAGALDDGAELRVREVSRPRAAIWLNTRRVGPVVTISPTHGRLRGTARITFRVPSDVHLRQAFVSVYSPQLRARLPVPTTVDRRRRTLTVTTHQLSTWELDQADPDLREARNALAKGIAKDAVKGGGNPSKPFLERLYPTIPELSCGRPSRSLTYMVTDYGLPHATQVCAEATDKPNVALVKLLNVHTYPVDVRLPPGVSLEPKVIQTDDLAEVLSQLTAALTQKDHFLLRRFHTATLRVRVDDLPANARITEDVDPANLVKDMGFWLAGFASDQEGAKYDQLKKVLKTKTDIDQLTTCFTDALNAVQNRHERFSGKNGEKHAEQFIHDVLKKCVEPAGKAIHGFWAKARHDTAKVAKDASRPIVTQLKQLKRLWDDPVVLHEWVEGLIAGFAPQHAGRVTVTLSRRDPTVYFDAAPQHGFPPDFVVEPKSLSGRIAAFTGLKWQDWGSDVARARGDGQISHCQPACVAGNREAGPVSIELSKVEDIGDRWAYQCLTAEITLADGGVEYRGTNPDCDLPEDRPAPVNGPGGRACASVPGGERDITRVRVFGGSCHEARKVAKVGWSVAPPGWDCGAVSQQGDYYRCARAHTVVRFRAIGSD